MDTGWSEGHCPHCGRESAPGCVVCGYRDCPGIACPQESVMRKIIQITATTMVTEGFTPSDSVYALCDDGSVWVYAVTKFDFDESRTWYRMPPIPQDSEGGA